MTTRAYDYTITLNNTINFSVGDVVVGSVSGSIADISYKNANVLKVRLANSQTEFISGEKLLVRKSQLYSVNTFIDHSSNIAEGVLEYTLPVPNALSDEVHVYVDRSLFDKAYYYVTPSSIVINSNVLGATETTNFYQSSSLLIQVVSNNIQATTYVAANIYSYIEVANSTIVSISGTPYIAEKNSYQQTPIVKLYTIYYPGEWYPSKTSGNPSSSGDGYPWPYGFPLRYAEFYGDTTDLPSTVLFGGVEYNTVTINGGTISTDSSGTIGSTSLEISNFDGNIASLVEDRHILGYNSSNSAVAIINGELVGNIDPRTVPGNQHYNANIAASRGINTAWTYSTTIENGDTWVPLKKDSRDLLGAVVDIKMTYAKFLDYWPEYSTSRSAYANTVTMRSSVPYRIGDTIKANSTANTYTITNIVGNTLYLASVANIPIGDKVFIINSDADNSAYVGYVFTLAALQEMNDFSIKFNLTNWLQYFKMEVPARKFYKATCPWRYKGNECKYPSNGSGNIVGSNQLIQSNGFFTITNVPTSNVSQDVCAKTYTACSLRKNLLNFGGFPNAS